MNGGLASQGDFLNFRVSFGYRSGYRSDPAYVFGKYSLFDETTIEYV